MNLLPNGKQTVKNVPMGSLGLSVAAETLHEGNGLSNVGRIPGQTLKQREVLKSIKYCCIASSNPSSPNNQCVSASLCLQRAVHWARCGNSSHSLTQHTVHFLCSSYCSRKSLALKGKENVFFSVSELCPHITGLLTTGCFWESVTWWCCNPVVL